MTLLAAPRARFEAAWRRAPRDLARSDGALGALAGRLADVASLAEAAARDVTARAAWLALVERQAEVAADLPAATLAGLLAPLGVAPPAAGLPGGYPDGASGGDGAPTVVTWFDPATDELAVERTLRRMEPLRGKPDLPGDLVERLETLLGLARRRGFVVLAVLD